MEEDTGKSLHVGGATGRIHGADYSLVDYNRAGIPLIEIVTKPIEGTGARAPRSPRPTSPTLRELLRALGVSDVRMEQGSLRCDVNLSLRPTRRRSAPAPRPRTSTRCARSSARCATRSAGRPRVLPTAARSCRRPGTGTRTPASPPRAGRSPTPRTTATSPSPTWSRSPRPRSGSRSCAATLPEPPRERRRAAAGRLGLQRPRDARRRQRRCARPRRGDRRRRVPTRRPPASGGPASSPAGPTSDGVELADLPSPRPRSPSSRRSSTSGRLNDKLARQVLEGVLAGEGAPTRSSTPAAWRWSPTTVRCSRRRRRGASPRTPTSPRRSATARSQAAGALVGAVMKEMRGQADAAVVRELILGKLS
jgi:aspartyl-tRNA(Asn)/glutamyl-tRNA(Gln) amidotransferase subunit B